MSTELFKNAASRLQIALHRMVRDYPFHAHLLSASRFGPDPAIGTMAVTVRNGDVWFLYAPAFVDGCTFDQLAGVLHHEINHVLFEHLFANPVDYPDREARMIAEEVTVNEWVREPLPGRPITLDGYPNLPPGEDTDTRYAKLVQMTPSTGPKTSPGVPKTGGRGTKNGDIGTKSPGILQPLDNHELWAEVRTNPVLGKLAVRVLVRQARETLTPARWQQLPGSLQTRIEDISQGRDAGSSSENVGPCGHPLCVLDWRRLLRRYVGQAVERQPVFNRPPRRFPKLVGLVPGQALRAFQPRVMGVLDTSGSMAATTIAQIGGELARMNRAFEVVVVECDAQIQATYPYRGVFEQVRGRGGTDLRPPFAGAFLARHRPDVIVYFTDGAGPAPERAPRVPVIWCLTPKGKMPATWGRCVRMTA